MPATRSQRQQQLKVDQTSNGDSTLDTKSSKRKEAPEKGNDDSASGEQGNAGRDASPHEENAQQTREQGEPPAKAQKVDDDKDDVKQEEEQQKDDGQAAEQSSPATQQPSAKSQEKVLDGKDVGTVGSNGDEVKWNVVERGHVYFFYRPKVQPASEADKDAPAAQSIDDTQNFHMLLLPRASDSPTAPAAKSEDARAKGENKSEQTGEKARVAGIGARLIRLGKKRMPDPKAAIANGDQPGGIGGDSSEAIWAVVSDVSPSFDSLRDSLTARRYTTKTAGERVVGSSRPAGRGWYVLTVSETSPPSSREVRLSYALSHPHDPADFGAVQAELGLKQESSVRLQMRNPTLPNTGAGAPPAGLDPSDRVQLSEGELEENFGGEVKDGESGGGTRYARPENIELLDRAGVELLMIKKREQEAEDDMGVGDTHEKALEKLASQDAQDLSSRDALRELQLDAKEHPLGALDGEWI